MDGRAGEWDRRGMPHVPPPLIALAAAGAQRLLAPTAPAGTARRVVAGAVATGSAALAGTTARRFRVAGTTLDPGKPALASTLVTDGANTLTRNPMYVGLAGLLVAHAVARGGWPTWLPVAGFVTVIDRLQIPSEEEALRARFGQAYDDYCASVRRWL